MILTQKSPLFKYLIVSDGLTEVLLEQFWDVGIESIDSLEMIDGIIYFWGSRGDQISLYVWDGNSPPREIGALNKDVLDAALSEDFVRTDLVKGLYVPFEKKYLLSIAKYA